MRVLVACERYGRVRNAFIARGHDAMSCDILPTETPGPHHTGDVRDLLGEPWDLMVAFPPCTYLTNSNAWRWHRIAHEREEALDFVRELMSVPYPWCVENPAGAIGTRIRPADQYVHPWWWGEPYQKRTGLWLSGLPLLRPSVAARPDGVVPWVSAGYRTGGGSGVHRRSDLRGQTFLGVARAMADQWGGCCEGTRVVG